MVARRERLLQKRHATLTPELLESFPLSLQLPFRDPPVFPLDINYATGFTGGRERAQTPLDPVKFIFV